MSQFNEAEFKLFESKIDDVLRILEEMSDCGEKPDPENNKKTNGKSEMDYESDSIGKTAYNLYSDLSNVEDFIVKVRDNRTVINNTNDNSNNESKGTPTMDQFTFMRQLEQDATMRAENRKNREIIADNFRRLGNQAFREQRYEEAINLYTKAIDHIKDSPILYNNRVLTYIKLKIYKRALIDCDFVINRLDEKNLRSWLYRAVAYRNLDDQVNFEKSVKMAKKHNANEIDYIDKFIRSIQNF